MVVRDREGKDLSIDLFLTLDKSEELSHSSHCESHAVGILPVGDVESRSPALHFACEEREVHVVCGHEKGLVASDEVANEGRKLLALSFRKCFPFESNGIVGLWTSPRSDYGAG
jgi:hypothetical protein